MCNYFFTKYTTLANPLWLSNSYRDGETIVFPQWLNGNFIFTHIHDAQTILSSTSIFHKGISYSGKATSLYCKMSINYMPLVRKDPDIIFFLIRVTSWWAWWRLKSPAPRLFNQLFTQAQIKENIKAPRHWPLCGEFTGDRWIPCTKGQ